MAINPYTKLKEAAQKFAHSVEYRDTKVAFSITVDDVNTRYIKAAVTAADILGYNAEVYVENETLKCRYIKKLPSVPYELRY